MAIAPLLDLESPWPQPALRLIEPGAGRRPVSARVRHRRRQALAGLAVAGAAMALALPVSSLGGRPVAGVPGSSSVVGTGSTVYVVRPGDTLWSIATRIDRGGDPRALAEALVRETGSSTVVPGERIRVP